MTALVLTMVLIIVVAAAVVAYVAYPHRGEKMPVLPQVGMAMSKAVDQLPTVDQTTDWPAPTPDLATAEEAKVGAHRA